MRFCVSFIERMANNDSDARNEAAVNFAKAVMSRTSFAERAMPYV
jgi:hypothetical protein